MIIIAHRGASYYAPENTIYSFRKAVEMGCNAFEFDVHRSLDGELIIHHDYDFKKTARINRLIKDLRYDEIKKINVALHFNPDIFACPPTLNEVLDIIKSKASFINIEIKNDDDIYPDIEDDILKIIKNDNKIIEKVVFSSFYFPSLKKIRQKSKKYRLGFLSHSLDSLLLTTAINKAKDIACESFHINRKIAFKNNIEILKKNGFKVYIYTVNNKSEAIKFNRYGVDGIFSNKPDII